MAESAKEINHWRNFRYGASRSLVLAPKREYQPPKRGDFARDARAMREDFANIARDMDYAVRKYGER